MNKALPVIAVVVAALLLAGCTGTPVEKGIKYVCPNGSIVNDSALCATATITPSATPTAAPMDDLPPMPGDGDVPPLPG